MTTLIQLLQKNEDWLMRRVLEYALEHGFTAYTSTLVEAWRLSISGLSAAIISAARSGRQPPRIMAESELAAHPITQFGLLEAKRHQERGISLAMFFGLLKQYRQAYVDLLQSHRRELDDFENTLHFFSRIFDIIEAGILVGWAAGDSDQVIYRMQLKNREMTNEKNKYLTIFESIPNPVFLLSPTGEIDNCNFAATRLIDSQNISGDHYYTEVATGNRSPQARSNDVERSNRFAELLPWLATEILEFYRLQLRETVFEKEAIREGKPHIFRVKISQMLDVSQKFTGAVLILEDITSLKDAQATVRTLEGFIPICSHCKKMREDDGYWSRIEEYLEKRSTALFTHSICDECVQKYYSHIL